MSRLRVAPIVEGHGEVSAVRILLQRVWTELLGGQYADVLQPIRRPRTLLTQPEEIRRAVELATLKLRLARKPVTTNVVLLLLDVDPYSGPPCDLAPGYLAAMQGARPDVDSICVLANQEYETWFVAAAESLGLENLSKSEIPEDPEASRSGKGWILKRLSGYSETVDQPALTSRMDLHLCRRRSLSFDKLCRELEARRGD